MRRFILLAALAAAACSDSTPEAPRPLLRQLSAGAVERPDPATSAVWAVQLGTYSDSARALRTARALADSGWNPVVHPVVAGEARFWRVYVALAADSVLPEFVAAGIRVVGREALVVQDTLPTAQLAGVPAVSQAVPVIRFGERMTARTRWALSPDSTALIAVQDPMGEGNEATPNGAVFASERVNCYAVLDSVWDVAPSPAWDRLAIGRAYGITTPGGAPPGAMERALAEQLRVSEDTLRSAAFPMGREPIRRGFVRPVVLDLPGRAGWRPFGGGPALRTRTVPMLGGWRLRWTDDGTLAVGSNPPLPKDNSPARGWAAVSDTGGPRALSEGEVDALEDALERTGWASGPRLDPSLPVILTRGRPPSAEGRVTSAGGWIRVADARGRRRIIGPGVPLAVTRTGSFVLALAPQPATLRDAPTAQLVVYAARAGDAPSVPGACRMVDVPG
ncbi:MAG TPA: hypothetical protein VNA89_10505 [Gemmatimonadaceae bacterium]|nr:hypothetical protein [Gemmatimonadaceae bacterium]